LINNVGYFLDAKSSLSNKFIFCDNENCKTTTQSNGYFINSLPEVYICKNSLCETFYTYENCENNHEIIHDEGYFYFCLDDGRVSLSEAEKYFKISNISASSIFPKIENGIDDILIKIDKYSVTQYINDSNGSIILK